MSTEETARDLDPETSQACVICHDLSDLDDVCSRCLRSATGEEAEDDFWGEEDADA